MGDEYNAKEELKKALTHSTRLQDIEVTFTSQPLRCGFPTIERYEYILANESNMVIIAARPGHGKTALACQIGLQTSKNTRVLFFSLEMKKEALKKRMLAIDANVPIRKLGESAFAERVQNALERQTSYKFDIIDDSGLTCRDIVARIYDEFNRERIGCIIIDYIGIIKVDNNMRAISIGEAARMLKKEVADKLKIPVIVLAQMKRGFEDKYAKAKFDYEKARQYSSSTPNEKLLEIRPALEDLGESSGLEHNADLVMFLYRPYLNDPTYPESVFKVFVAKNRNGTVKDFNLEFSSAMTKFIDKGVEEDI